MIVRSGVTCVGAPKWKALSWNERLDGKSGTANGRKQQSHSFVYPNKALLRLAISKDDSRV